MVSTRRSATDAGPASSGRKLRTRRTTDLPRPVKTTRKYRKTINAAYDASYNSMEIRDTIAFQPFPSAPDRSSDRADSATAEHTYQNALSATATTPPTVGDKTNPIILAESPEHSPATSSVQHRQHDAPLSFTQKDLGPHSFARQCASVPHIFAHRNVQGNNKNDTVLNELGREVHNTTFTGDRELDMYRMSKAMGNIVWNPSAASITASESSTFSGAIHQPPKQDSKKPSHRMGSVQAMVGEFGMLTSLTGSRGYDSSHPKAKTLRLGLPSHAIMHKQTDLSNLSREVLRPSQSRASHKSWTPDNNPHGSSHVTARELGTELTRHDQRASPHISQLQRMASLITYLLQIYPTSDDQEHLRTDIAVLLANQTQGLARWIDAEASQSRKGRRMTTDSAIELSRDHTPLPSRPLARTLRVQDSRSKQDEEIRTYMSASAPIWGNSMTLPEVFAPASSPEANLRWVSRGKQADVDTA